jgi:hypothetical protein
MSNLLQSQPILFFFIIKTLKLRRGSIHLVEVAHWPTILRLVNLGASWGPWGFKGLKIHFCHVAPIKMNHFNWSNTVIFIQSQSLPQAAFLTFSLTFSLVFLLFEPFDGQERSCVQRDIVEFVSANTQRSCQYESRFPIS